MDLRRLVPPLALALLLGACADGATNCAGVTGTPTFPPRPTGATTVHLAAAGAVLDTLRATPTDDLGCVDRVDPTVAPSNDPDDRLLPAIPSTVVVCEYGRTDPTPGDTDDTAYWIVGSRTLSASELTRFVAACNSAQPGGAAGPPFTTVLRYLVTLPDGRIRTLTSQADVGAPQPVSDGQHDDDVTAPGGNYPALPSVY